MRDVSYPKDVRLRGTVVSGRGDFSYWIERLSSHYQQKTGMRLYPGTLNLQLDHPYSLPKKVIRLESHDPRTIIEIAADVRLRDLYQLTDGDWVEVDIPEAV
jgi:riboflavin kinase